jgi:hypothetical protein
VYRVGAARSSSILGGLAIFAKLCRECSGGRCTNRVGHSCDGFATVASYKPAIERNPYKRNALQRSAERQNVDDGSMTVKMKGYQSAGVLPSCPRTPHRSLCPQRFVRSDPPTSEFSWTFHHFVRINATWTRLTRAAVFVDFTG